MFNVFCCVMLALLISTTPLWRLSPTCRDAACSVRHTGWLSVLRFHFLSLPREGWGGSSVSLKTFPS